MIFRTPSYYKKFKCIASRCSDNCCIGWEIDIDRISRKKYEGVSGSFGDRLRENMVTSPDGSCSFRLLEHERCAFLNKDNLCDLILQMGEDSLCQICRDHPRYFEWFADGTKEGGIGLCCEEAARIILSEREPFRVTETVILSEEDPAEEGFYDAGYSDLVKELRDDLLTILEETVPVREALILILEKGSNAQILYDRQTALSRGEEEPDPVLKPEEIRNSMEEESCRKEILLRLLDLLSDTEPMSEKWPEYLEGMREYLENSENSGVGSGPDPCEEKVTASDRADDTQLFLKNIAQYFIWRYTGKGVFEEDGFFLPYVVTPVILTLFAEAMFEKLVSEGETADLDACVKLIKDLSKEVEYDEDFFERILEEACEIFGA